MPHNLPTFHGRSSERTSTTPASTTFWLHHPEMKNTASLHQIFRAFAMAKGLRCGQQSGKASLRKTQVKFLDHLVPAEGTGPFPEKIMVITNYPKTNRATSIPGYKLLQMVLTRSSWNTNDTQHTSARQYWRHNYHPRNKEVERASTRILLVHTGRTTYHRHRGIKFLNSE